MTQSTIKIIKLSMTVAMFSIAACDETNVSELLADKPNYEYNPNCDRELRLRSSKDGKNTWSLSQVGCMVYSDGFVEKPAFLPAIRKEFLLFDSSEYQGTPTKCKTSIKEKVVTAKCGGDKHEIGKLKSSKHVALKSRYQFDVVIKDGDYRRFLTEDEPATVRKKGYIAFRKK